MKSSNNEKILESFNRLFSNLSERDKLDNEAKLVMFRFLDIIERKREKLGWTRKELAESIGTSASYITQMMRGDKLINMNTLAKMQRALGIQFEISEKTSYYEKTKYLTYPVSDGKGMWYWKPFINKSPGYDKNINLPKTEPEKKIA
jgi:ribosome-binding protein aMBF1 (putative translation factor)